MRKYYGSRKEKEEILSQAFTKFDSIPKTFDRKRN